jgi:hypothetical protein
MAPSHVLVTYTHHLVCSYPNLISNDPPVFSISIIIEYLMNVYAYLHGIILSSLASFSLSEEL